MGLIHYVLVAKYHAQVAQLHPPTGENGLFFFVQQGFRPFQGHIHQLGRCFSRPSWTMIVNRSIKLSRLQQNAVDGAFQLVSQIVQQQA
ncbi:hypothetical protein MHO82_21215 [Vibrio sp. Of7-15]|uniref:hypothetical protein n=1 Tax=Vibrio sp. Of7-15 TaxID=2724879 RepID=UPI001EF1E0FB|nr:hypothetical protein [Vibrio sp. Of7-15]MCG7499390.1 hypothetical protein [Vibrio sp. Of7-15]